MFILLRFLQNMIKPKHSLLAVQKQNDVKLEEKWIAIEMECKECLFV